MAKYTGANLAAMSTILGCATRTQLWNTLGTAGANTQEEVQMLRVGDAFYIACNSNGHSYIQQFLTAFGVSDEPSFLTALKWAHLLISADHGNYKDWTCDAGNKSKYSIQEKATIDAFAFPSKVPKTASDGDITAIYNCVGKAVRGVAAPTTATDWKVTPFQQLLAWYSNKAGYKAAVGLVPGPAANLSAKSLTQAVDLNLKITLINNTSATIHAEIKLLAYLTKMVIDGNVTEKHVYLGGLKGACRRCKQWIESYSYWLRYHKDIKLHLPVGDARPSAAPVHWSEPPLEQYLKDDTTLKANISGLFT